MNTPMTIDLARAIIDARDFKHPRYKEARHFRREWMLANDRGTQIAYVRIATRMAQDFVGAGLMSAEKAASLIPTFKSGDA